MGRLMIISQGRSVFVRACMPNTLWPFTKGRPSTSGGRAGFFFASSFLFFVAPEPPPAPGAGGGAAPPGSFRFLWEFTSAIPRPLPPHLCVCVPRARRV